MESQFEIVGRDTPEMHRQLYQIVCKPFMKPVAILFFVCAAGQVLLGCFEQDAARFFSAAVYCLGPVWIGQVPRMAAKHSYKERLKYYDGETPETIARFGEKMIIEDEDSTRTISYDKITKIHYIQDAIVIRVEKLMIVAVPHQTFVKGSLPELKQFLREKCPNAKFPK